MNLKPISNRSGERFELPADGWFQLSPKGEFLHRPTGITQVVDEKAIKEMVNRFQAESKARNFPGILVDYEHFSYDESKESRAAGWIKELQNRDDGLYAKIRWTENGEEDLRSGEYRFVSPVWMPTDAERVADKKLRPLRLDRAGLTNDPNIKGMVPLSNRDLPSREIISGNNAGQTKGNKMKRVLLALGLSEDASEESALTAVDVLKNRVSTVEAGQTELKNRAVTLETENKALLETQVETDLEKYKDRIAEGKKESWKKALLANRSSAIELLEGITPGKTEGNEGNKGKKAQPLHNRSTAGNPTSVTEGAARTAEDQAKAIEKEVQTYKLANRCSYEDAWNQVYQNKPELFATAGTE